jgi:hypothetical protein
LNERVKIVDTLISRLANLPDKRWRRNEMFKIINDFLLSPSVAKLIEDNNKIHRAKICTNDGGGITALKIQYEKDKKPGFWNWLKRLFAPYATGVKIWHNEQLFLCEYYRHGFFSLCDTAKAEYDEKLKSTFGCDFVVVSRAL